MGQHEGGVHRKVRREQTERHLALPNHHPLIEKNRERHFSHEQRVEASKGRLRQQRRITKGQRHRYGQDGSEPPVGPAQNGKHDQNRCAQCEGRKQAEGERRIPEEVGPNPGQNKIQRRRRIDRVGG